MDKERVIYFIENSFISPLIKDANVTDISFNGDDLFYVSNVEGRKKFENVISRNEVKDFIRQIANLCEKQFSYSVPQLDVFVGKYRINAIHSSIAKIKDDGVITFSIRIASDEIRIKENSEFINPQLTELLDIIMRSKQSIVIGGITSTGKTELQKYLISRVGVNSRIIVIDNVLELDRIRNKNIDLTCWQIDEQNPNASASVLIKQALRNNPDWIILAEARDKEMIDVLNAAMTGMPIITTLHSLDVFSLPHRMSRLMLRGDQKIDFNEALNDIYYHFHFYIYLEKREIDNKIERFISKIAFFSNNGIASIIYEKKERDDLYHHLNQEILDTLLISNCSALFKKTFIRS